MMVGSGLPASDLSEKSSAWSRTPSLIILAALKSMLSGALYCAASAGPVLAGSGGRVCWAVGWDDWPACWACALLLAPSARPTARLTITLTTDLLVTKIDLLERTAYAA